MKEDGYTPLQGFDTSRTIVVPLKKIPEYKEPETLDKIRDENLGKLRVLENRLGNEIDDIIQKAGDDGIVEAVPNDYGLLAFVHSGDELSDSEDIHQDGKFKDTLGKKKMNAKLAEVGIRHFKYSNIFKNLNDLEANDDRMKADDNRFHPMRSELIAFLLPEEGIYGDLVLVNPFVQREIINDQKKTKTMKACTTTATGGTGHTMRREFDARINTNNSFVVDEQIRLIHKLKKLDESVIAANLDYKNRKENYEVELVIKLIERWDELDGIERQKANSMEAQLNEAYVYLKEKTANEVENYKKNIKEGGNLTSGREIRQINKACKRHLAVFMQKFLEKYKELVEKDSSGKQFKTYLQWKSKLSELVNIWEVNGEANGMECRLPYKYLILKKFLTLRAISRQDGKEFVKISKDSSMHLNPMKAISSMKNLFGADKDEDLPIGIFEEQDTLRLVMDIIVTLLLLYSFFTVPLRLFLENETALFTLMEKFVDMYFYIDIMVTFRTAFRDKFNIKTTDILKITRRYLTTFFLIDFVSTIPWSYFAINSGTSIFKAIKLITHVLKILRMIKLFPILNRLEKLKGANLFRFGKIMLVYLLFTHWMACILFYGVLNSVNYNILGNACYISNVMHEKRTLTQSCKYVISFYNAAFVIPGQYTSYMIATTILASETEYIVLIFEFIIGQVVSAYAFGGMTNIIQTLDQGQNFFTAKTDLLREHMMFYEIDDDIQNDIRVYYDYLWQRHKDVVYGKQHFNNLSVSLSELFERINLVGHEIYLGRFTVLENQKLIGFILRHLKKIVLFPYEILFEEGSLTEGMYVLTNGDINFCNNILSNLKPVFESITFGDVMKLMEKYDERNPPDLKYSIIFPLVSVFLKTGRTYQRCFGAEFADLLFMPLEYFEEIITSYPQEMHILRHQVMQMVEKNKLFNNQELFKMIAKPSARSFGKYYERRYDERSIWIPIAIPVSQRKIDRKYVTSYVDKVKGLWREIIVSGDMNICLKSPTIVNALRSEKQKGVKVKGDDMNIVTGKMNELDRIKGLAKALDVIVAELTNNLEKIQFYER